MVSNRNDFICKPYHHGGVKSNEVTIYNKLWAYSNIPVIRLTDDKRCYLS